MCVMEVRWAVECTRSWSVFTGINEYGYIDGQRVMSRLIITR